MSYKREDEDRKIGRLIISQCGRPAGILGLDIFRLSDKSISLDKSIVKIRLKINCGISGLIGISAT